MILSRRRLLVFTSSTSGSFVIGDSVQRLAVYGDVQLSSGEAELSASSCFADRDVAEVEIALEVWELHKVMVTILPEGGRWEFRLTRADSGYPGII
jgi:hypothetical protein